MLASIFPKESPCEKILGSPPNLQLRLPSISSVVVHSILVPEVSKVNIFPASHVKALSHTVKYLIYKLSVVVVPAIAGINIIVVLFPSTEKRLIFTFPNFGGSGIFPSGTTLKVSPVDVIVALPIL